MTLIKFCTHCLERTPVKLVIVPEKIEIQDEVITFDAQRYLCTKCNKYTSNDDLTDENMTTAYRKFRDKKGMLQPEDFFYIRNDIYQVSVRVMAKLIGCSPATLSRYENGSLQSKQHDIQFKTLSDPRAMKKAFESSKNDIPEKDKKALQERLSFLLDTVKSGEILKGLDDKLNLLKIEEQDWNDTDREEIEKFFIIKGQEFREEEDNLRISPLKLQKLMYYAQGWTHAFTGHDLFKDDFQAWIHGPVIPEVYHKYKPNGSRKIEQNFDTKIEDLNLSNSQLSILHWVWEKYSKFEAKFLEDLTHMEFPWVETRGDLSPNEACDWTIEKKDIHHFFDSMYTTLRMLQKLS